MLSILLATAALATPGTFDGLPVWSPNGAKIAFIREIGRNSYLEVARSDGSGLRRLSRKAFGWPPSWSPDSRSLAFTRVQHGRDVTIWTVRVDGTRLRKVASGLEPAWSPRDGTIAYGHGCDPQWSPGGGAIAFDDPGAERDSSTIFLMDPDGTDVRPLLLGS